MASPMFEGKLTRQLLGWCPQHLKLPVGVAAGLVASSVCIFAFKLPQDKLPPAAREAEKEEYRVARNMKRIEWQMDYDSTLRRMELAEIEAKAAAAAAEE